MSCPCEQKPYVRVSGFGHLGRLGASATPDGGAGGDGEEVAPAAIAAGGSSAGVSRWDAKRDIIAGGVGLGLPIAYSYLAPKKWPQANVFAQVAMVVVGYFGAVWAYRKLSE